MRNSILKKVFTRSSSKVNFFQWYKLLILEIYMGDQLLEMLTNTASFNKDQSGDIAFDIKSNGWKVELEEYIPATYINFFLKRHIVELLELKFLNHYQLVEFVNRKEDEKNLLYQLNNSRLFLLTELKLCYGTLWVGFNLLIDLIIYVITNDIALALLAGGLIEFVRRFKI